MKPEQKAECLINSFGDMYSPNAYAKICAITCVEEILRALNECPDISYWKEVKERLKGL